MTLGILLALFWIPKTQTADLTLRATIKFLAVVFGVYTLGSKGTFSTCLR